MKKGRRGGKVSREKQRGRERRGGKGGVYQSHFVSEETQIKGRTEYSLPLRCLAVSGQGFFFSRQEFLG